jgi:hypothetical protein
MTTPEQHQNEPTLPELAIPQVAVLQSVQNNIFCDAALQSIGLVIIGQAITTHPDLMDEKTWVNYSITPEDNANWQQFNLRSEPVGHIPVSGVMGNLDFLIETVQGALLTLVQQEPNTVLAGSMRLNITITGGDAMDEEPKLQIWLLWISTQLHPLGEKDGQNDKR